MSDVEAVKEAIAQWDDLIEREYGHGEITAVVLDAARSFVRMAEGLDYEAAAEALVRWGPSYLSDAQVAKAIVDAAVGSRRLVDPQLLEGG